MIGFKFIDLVLTDSLRSSCNFNILETRLSIFHKLIVDASKTVFIKGTSKGSAIEVTKNFHIISFAHSIGSFCSVMRYIY